MEPTSPIYAFSIAPMYPNPGVQERNSRHGRWRPPKAHGNNLTQPPAYFVSNTNSVNAITQTVPALPPSASPHKTYSIYYDRAIIWTIDYDASQEKVGDGIEDDPPPTSPLDDVYPGPWNASAFRGEPDDDESTDEEDDKDDWAPMKFDHRDSDQLSYAGRRQPHSRLCAYRRDQEWAQKLFPDTCNAQVEATISTNGGLIGELPLLIGLMALAIPPGQLAHGLCQAMGRRWTTPRFERRAGWLDKRGMIVKTYACPPHSQVDDLIEYERGQRGIILQ